MKAGAMSSKSPIQNSLYLLRWSFFCVTLLVLATAGLVVFGYSHRGSGRKARPDGSAAAQQMRIAKSYGQLPLRFEVNEGQENHATQFLSRGSGYSLLLASSESVLQLRDQPLGSSASQPNPSSILRMKLLGASRTRRARGLERLPSTSNYFVGNDPKKWRTDVPNYAKVQFQNVYPGIDLVYYGNQQQLEYDFVVASGKDPGVIRIGFSGADMKIDEQGNLLLWMNGRELRWGKPVIYQEIAGTTHFVDGGYRVRDERTIGFDVPRFDPHYALVIDPVLIYSSYLGGSSSGEVAAAIAVDSSGNAYVTGSTGSTNFPTANAYQSALASNGTSTNAFVTKLNAAGDAVIYSTYLGGSGGGPAYGDGGTGIAIDSSGNAYIAGYTYSSDFPTAAAFQPNNAGAGDGFVAKLGPAGNTLLYSSYLGGSGQDGFSHTAITVDASGNAVVAGNTYSTDFPTVNAGQPTYGGQGDCFVTKVNSSGTVAFSTYFGGNNLDDCEGLALDSSGNIYLAGSSLSSDFPFTGGVGKGHGFVAKLQNSGSGIIYATQLGGISGNNGDAGAGGVAVDSAGNAYLFGGTTATDLPITTTAFQGQFGGGVDDTFVMKIDSAGSNLLYCSYLGGSQGEQGIAIAIDSGGHMYVTGNTASPDFPVSNAFQQTYGGGQSDVFVAEFDPLGTTATSLVYSTFMGGTNADHGYGIAVDGSGNAYVSGNTGGGFPTTPGAFQTTYGGSVNDGFVAKISGSGGATQAANINAVNGASQIVMVDAPVSSPFSATVTDSSGNGVPNQSVTFTAPSSGASGSFAGGGTTSTATTNANGIATSTAFTANTTAGAYNVTATVAGVSGSASFSLTNIDFSVASTTAGSVQITGGSSANVTLNLTTAPAGAALPVDVNYSCSVQTSLTGVSCSLSPTKTAAGSTSGSTIVKISSTSSALAALSPSPIGAFSLIVMAPGILGMLGLRKFQRESRRVLLPLTMLLLCFGIVSCSNSPKPKGGSGTVTVTSTAGSLSRSTTINFTVQ